MKIYFKENVLYFLKKIIRQNDMIIRRLSMLHNEKNVKNQKPLAWLDEEQREKLSSLAVKNPEMFEYITEVLKAFLGCEE